VSTDQPPPSDGNESSPEAATQESGPEPETTAPGTAEAERMAARALRRVSSSGSAKSRSSRGAKTPTHNRPLGAYRDPREVGAILDTFLSEQGWQSTSAIAAISASWPQIVGPEVAEHVQVESVVDGQLRLVADSTAWATQVRLLADTVLAQVHEAVGSQTVDAISVRGPNAPSWRAGPRVVKGRGPRDTYG